MPAFSVSAGGLGGVLSTVGDHMFVGTPVHFWNPVTIRQVRSAPMNKAPNIHRERWWLGAKPGREPLADLKCQTVQTFFVARRREARARPNRPTATSDVDSGSGTFFTEIAESVLILLSKFRSNRCCARKE